MAIAIAVLNQPEPSALTIASASRIAGNAKSTSLTRITIASTQPPKKPAATPATVPIVTIVGIQFGYLLGGAVIVEQIFALPGLGRQVLSAIGEREYAVVQSTVLVIAAAFVLVNFLTDLLYRRIDPRVREL